MQLVIRIGEGEMYPRGYGVAWREWECNRTACMPVPLNIVCGLARRLYFWSRRCVAAPTARDKMLIMAHLDGYSKGRAAERERIAKQPSKYEVFYKNLMKQLGEPELIEDWKR